MAGYIILTLLSVTGLVAGYRRWISFENLNKQRALAIFSVIISIMILTGILSMSHIISRTTAELTTGALYLLFAGYFLGSTIRLLLFARTAGPVEYRQSSPLIRHLLNFLALAIIFYGLYRTHLLTSHPGDLLSWSSGISLICFGVYGWRLRLIPEFRKKGLLILDQWIPWRQLIGYQWYTEETIQIDYRRSNEHISDLKTGIPPRDQLFMERLLRKKMDQFASMSDDQKQMSDTHQE